MKHITTIFLLLTLASCAPPFTCPESNSYTTATEYIVLNPLNVGKCFYNKALHVEIIYVKSIQNDRYQIYNYFTAIDPKTKKPIGAFVPGYSVMSLDDRKEVKCPTK